MDNLYPTDDKIEQISENEHLCWNCKENEYVPEYLNKLCTPCRNAFINFPIPKWIWIFAGFVLVIMLIGVIRMPKYLAAAVHLARAEKAMESKRYLTAKKGLQEVLAEFPDNKELNGKLLISSAYSFDLEAMTTAYQKIKESKFEDESLLADIDRAMTYIANIYPSDTLLMKHIAAVKDSPDSLKKIYAETEKNSDSNNTVAAGYSIADYLYDKDQFSDSEAILNKTLAIQADFRPALELLAAVKRKLGKYDEGIALCDKMLFQNREDLNALNQKTRIELLRKHDTQAATFAQEAMTIDPEDVASLEAMALVDFYTGKKNEGRKLVKKIEQKEIAYGDSTISTRILNIFNGTTTFR